MRPAKKVILWAFCITMTVLLGTYVAAGLGYFDADQASMLTLLITGVLGTFITADQLKSGLRGRAERKSQERQSRADPGNSDIYGMPDD